jgi:(p)ppGpp synthase/HD superfamily hydrolase
LIKYRIKSQLGDENFRIYKDKKQYNAFDSEKNTSTATINKILRKIEEGDNTLEVETDLFGEVYDSEDGRASVLKISSDEKDVEYKLHTNIGQLGS